MGWTADFAAGLPWPGAPSAPGGWECGLVGALTVLFVLLVWSVSYVAVEVSLRGNKKPSLLSEGCALVLDRFKC